MSYMLLAIAYDLMIHTEWELTPPFIVQGSAYIIGSLTSRQLDKDGERPKTTLPTIKEINLYIYMWIPL